MTFANKAASVALSYRVETKSDAARHLALVTDTAEGRTFKGYASTWDADLGGDVIMRGAYADTLARWRTSGKSIPLVDSHAYGSVFNVVGKMIAAHEDETGLLATFEVIPGNDGTRVLERVRSGAVEGMSIGYRVPAGGQREPDARLKALGVRRIINKIALNEVSLVMYPMNPNARVTSPDGKGIGRGVAPDDPRRATPQWMIDYRAKRDAEVATEAETRQAKLAALRASVARLERHSVAPNSPERLALEAKLRDLKLRQLRLQLSA